MIRSSSIDFLLTAFTSNTARFIGKGCGEQVQPESSADHADNKTRLFSIIALRTA
jgi:hypothetical protein